MPLYQVPEETDSQDSLPACDETDVSEKLTATVYGGANEDSVSSLDGTPWYVIYYNQFLKEDDQPRQLDFNLSPALQQYHRINNFIVSISDTLTSSTDNPTAITTVTGSAELHPGVVPHVGDHFIGRLPSNREAVMVVKNVNRKTYLTKTAWVIDYEMFAFSDRNHVEEFARKTIETFNFDEGRVGTGNPLVDESSAKEVETIGILMGRIVNEWYDQFFDQQTLTALVPTDDNSSVYDPYVVNFMRNLIDNRLRNRHPELKRYSTGNGDYDRKHKTIWSILMDGECYGLCDIPRYSEVVSSRNFTSSRVYSSIGNSFIDKVVHCTAYDTLQNSATHSEDETYVFSKAFYDKDSNNMSKVEQLVHQGFNCKELTLSAIGNEVNQYLSWSARDRFYYFPALVWVLKRLVAHSG